MSNALVVLSGGQDSTTALFMAKEAGYKIHAITFDYGQRHRMEITAAKHIALMANIDGHEILQIPNILRSTSPLVDHRQPLEQYDSAEQMDKVIGDRIELTFVPMRNALFLTIAANRAITLGCDTIWIGVCEADNANYPDCRKTFIVAMSVMIAEALGKTNAPVIMAPLLHVPKPASVLLALQCPGCYAALGYSHTAYDGSYPPSGRDHATVLRAHAFETAGVPDPLIVRAVLEGYLLSFPTTENYTQHVDRTNIAKADFEKSGVEHSLNMLEKSMRQLQE